MLVGRPTLSTPRLTNWLALRSRGDPSAVISQHLQSDPDFGDNRPTKAGWILYRSAANKPRNVRLRAVNLGLGATAQPLNLHFTGIA